MSSNTTAWTNSPDLTHLREDEDNSSETSTQKWTVVDRQPEEDKKKRLEKKKRSELLIHFNEALKKLSSKSSAKAFRKNLKARVKCNDRNLDKDNSEEHDIFKLLEELGHDPNDFGILKSIEHDIEGSNKPFVTRTLQGKDDTYGYYTKFLMYLVGRIPFKIEERKKTYFASLNTALDSDTLHSIHNFDQEFCEYVKKNNVVILLVNRGEAAQKFLNEFINQGGCTSIAKYIPYSSERKEGFDGKLYDDESDDDESENESEPDPEEEPKEEPKKEPKEEPKEEPKKEPKEESKEEPKKEPKENETEVIPEGTERKKALTEKKAVKDKETGKWVIEEVPTGEETVTHVYLGGEWLPTGF